MPLNLIKKYPELLDILHLGIKDREKSLRGVFDRDITNNKKFQFRGNQIYPTVAEGKDPLDILFTHLTTTDEVDDNGDKTEKRIFESDRSKRLHWIRHHVEEQTPANIEVFSFKDRVNRTDQIRTYIYDKVEKYVIVLEPQRTGNSYYLLSAYYFNKPYGEKQIKKKMKRKLEEIH